MFRYKIMIFVLNQRRYLLWYKSYS